MKKFNVDEELYNLKNMGSKKSNSTQINNLFVPALVIACSCLALVGITFSANLVNEENHKYKIFVSIENGSDDEEFSTVVKEGAFSTNIYGNGAFGSISCSSGNLSYNAITGELFSSYIDRDTTCILSFMEGDTKYINVDEMIAVNDNDGVSYFYKGNSENNYITINNMDFRILRVNGDGTLRVVYVGYDVNGSYGSTPYNSSDLKKTLDRWFNNNFKGKNYVVEASYDNFNKYDYSVESLVDELGFSYSYVGTIGVNEAAILNQTSNYLQEVGRYYLSNYYNEEYVWVVKDGDVVTTVPSEKLQILPVINVKAVNLKGLGTRDNPYTIEED